MKKNILISIVSIFTLMFSLQNVNALETITNVFSSDEFEDYCNSELLKNLGDINRNQVIKINGVDNPLYCTFSNKEISLQKIKEQVPELLSIISQQYSFQELDDTNWKEYRDGMYKLIDINDKFNEGNYDFRVLNSFFNIYENYDINQEILQYLNEFKENSISDINSNANSLFDLGMLLPYYAPLAQNVQDKIMKNPDVSPLASINVSAAIAYASTYAKNPNKNNYYVFGSDCTNFVSQILEASGVNQEVYDSVYSGWWHKVNNGKHTHSRSWSVADTFARYMGVTYTTSSHFDFSQKVNIGDFISFDEENDGRWNHMAFVTDKDSGPACYDNGDYYDYKVAQHTSNYHAWVSSNTNNWELIEKDKGKYAIVRG